MTNVPNFGPSMERTARMRIVRSSPKDEDCEHMRPRPVSPGWGLLARACAPSRSPQPQWPLLFGARDRALTWYPPSSETVNPPVRPARTLVNRRTFQRCLRVRMWRHDCSSHPQARARGPRDRGADGCAAGDAVGGTSDGERHADDRRAGHVGRHALLPRRAEQQAVPGLSAPRDLRAEGVAGGTWGRDCNRQSAGGRATPAAR